MSTCQPSSVPCRYDNGSDRTRIVPTRNPTRQKKICPLPAGYPLKNYPQKILKPAGTRGYPIPANILKNIYFIKFLI